MAKDKQKRNTDWQPQAADAINLATIRWFASMMEAKAIELYGTRPQLMPDIEAALSKGLSAVMGIKIRKSVIAGADCPPGWVQCGDECAPKCLSDPAEDD